MQDEDQELNDLQTKYKAAVDEWIKTIRQEEELASVDHSVAAIDRWELAHDREDEQRNKVLAAKSAYEQALRKRNFGF